jgi:protein TonB
MRQFWVSIYEGGSYDYRSKLNPKTILKWDDCMEYEAKSWPRRNAKPCIIFSFLTIYFCAVPTRHYQQAFAASEVFALPQWHFFVEINSLYGEKCASLLLSPPYTIRLRSDTTDTNKTKGVALIQPPVPIKKVPPIYPRRAALAQAEGRVLIRALVDTAGKIKEIAVDSSAGEIFNKAALQAARQWQFKPAQQKNKPVEAQVIIPFTFKLDLLPSQRDLARQRGIPPPDSVEMGKPPEVIKRVNPQYPEIARQNNVQGSVWTTIWVDQTGEVKLVLVEKSSDSMLNPPSIEAARQFKFKPALDKSGNPIAIWLTIPFHFRLR